MPIPSNIPPFLLLLIMITISSSTVPSASRHHHHGRHHSLGAACSLTRHRALCIRSLSPFSNPSAGQSLHWWARAAVSVTVSETVHIYQYLNNVHDINRPSTKTMLKGKHINATLSDCVECFDDAVSQLHESLRQLRELKPGSGFGLEMSNVETGVSAALTNQDTCYDEIVQNLKGMEARRVRSRVTIAMHCSSNALALINELAAEGGSD